MAGKIYAQNDRAKQRRQFGLAGIGLIALAAAFGSDPAAAQTANLQELFGQVLLNPSDAAANTRYAQEAERQGELRKALAAYERIILANPNNTQARAEYERVKAALEPPTTRYQVGFGLQYESNVRLDPKSGKNDIAGQLSFRVDDTRRIGGTLWRSAVSLYGDRHLHTEQADFMYASASTGPVLTMGNGWRFQPTLNAETGFADYSFLFYSVGLGANFETTDGGWFRGMSFGVSYADFSKSNSTGIFETDNGRDAVVFSGKLRIGWDNIIAMQDFLMITPGVVYNLASSRQDRFLQLGITAAYAIRVASFEGGVGNVYLAPEVTLHYRDYAGPEDGHNNARHDFRVVPGLKAIGSYENKTVVLSYLFDDNMSNYNNSTFREGRDYKNHRVGLNFYVDF